MSWFSACRIRCSICQRSASDSPRSIALELGLRLLELRLRAVAVDLVREHRVVDERDRAILLHLEEAGAGRELADTVVAFAEVDARRAGLQRRDQRRVPREHADLAVGAGDDQHHGLAFERGAVRRDERDRERLVGRTTR